VRTLAPTAKITRIGGADRYATSRALISDPAYGAVPSTTMFVTSGRVFPDALSASPAAATITTPVLLVDGQATGLSADEKTLLATRGVKSATVFGGTATVSTALEADLKAAVRPTPMPWQAEY
jgi:putative cell wall-binding protein